MAFLGRPIPKPRGRLASPRRCAQFLIFIAATGLLWAHTSHCAYLDVYLIVFAAIALTAWRTRLISRTAA
jgi:hypothetical protein